MYNVKYKPNESVERYKVILIAKGFNQKYSIDYLELTQMMGWWWELTQMDEKNVFLNRDNEEEVYISLSLGYERNRKCCKLKESLIWSKTTYKGLVRKVEDCYD